MRDAINLDINITQRCNTVCAHCNRGIGSLDWSDVRDMTLDDAKRLADGIKRAPKRVQRIKLVGGEPTVHKHLLEIVNIFNPLCATLWVVTNGKIPLEKLPDMPQGAKYRWDMVKNKQHWPQYISPTDLGLEHKVIPDLRRCHTIRTCGWGAEPEGFTQCSLARTVNRALGRDESTLFSDVPSVQDPDREICRHCPMSVGVKLWRKLSVNYFHGEIECPTKSFTNVKVDYKVVEPCTWKAMDTEPKVYELPVIQPELSHG
jgi:hypothetical protein